MKTFENERIAVYEDKKGNTWVRDKRNNKRTYYPRYSNRTHKFSQRKKIG